MDVTGLFTNTPQEEGAQCTEDAMNNDAHVKTSPMFLVRLLEIIQEYNIFEFNGELYQQKIGSGMDQKHVPPYSNIFMAKKLDTKIEELAKKYIQKGINPLRF